MQPMVCVSSDATSSSEKAPSPTAGSSLLFFSSPVCSVLGDAGWPPSQTYLHLFFHEVQRGTKGSSVSCVPGVPQGTKLSQSCHLLLPITCRSLKFAAENQSLPHASRQPHTPAVLGSSPALQKPRAKKCTRDGLLVRVWRSVTKG